MNHLQCFGAILLDFVHNLIITIGSPIITDSTYKKSNLHNMSQLNSGSV